MLEAVILLGFFLLLFLNGLTLVSHGALILLLILELVSLPGLWLIFRMSPPFVPTPKKTMDTMLKLSHIRKGSRVYDLGCGDGRLVKMAAQAGAIAVGYELSVFTWLLAQWRTRGTKNVHIRFGDFWNKSYSDADVIFCYLLPKPMVTFEKKIWPTLKKGCRVVSHCFKMPGVTPDEKENGVYVYVKQ